LNTTIRLHVIPMVSSEFLVNFVLANMLFRITGKKILKKKGGVPSPLKDEARMKHLD
jgi:hypothetical protein